MSLKESLLLETAFFVTEVDLLGEEVFYILLISSVSKWAGQVWLEKERNLDMYQNKERSTKIQEYRLVILHQGFYQFLQRVWVLLSL